MPISAARAIIPQIEFSTAGWYARFLRERIATPAAPVRFRSW
jgi:hypothetical protein